MFNTGWRSSTRNGNKQRPAWPRWIEPAPMKKSSWFAFVQSLAITLPFITEPASGAAAGSWVWATSLANKKPCGAHAIAVDQDDNIYVTGIYGHKAWQSI